jgi:hypothetical protein
MTVLAAVQAAAIRIAGRRPTALFTSNDKLMIELADLVNETAVAVMKAHDWRKLTLLKTQGGDGTATEFLFPSDYDRMPIKGNIYSSRSQLPLDRAQDLDQWLEFQLTSVIGSPGVWIVVGNKLAIKPALATGESAKFYYISNLIVSEDEGVTFTKTQFDADGQTFILPERLLTLGLIWRWKAQKKFEYAEDMTNYNVALGEEAGREKGSRIITVGRQRLPYDAQMAYAGIIVP